MRIGIVVKKLREASEGLMDRVLARFAEGDWLAVKASRRCGETFSYMYYGWHRAARPRLTFFVKSRLLVLDDTEDHF